MPQPMLDAFDSLPGIAFVPMAVEGLGHKAELDDEVAGQVLRLGLAPFLPPQADQGCFILPMIIRASDPPINCLRSNLERCLRPVELGTTDITASVAAC